MIVLGIPADSFEDLFHLVEWHFQSFADRSKGEATVDDLKQQVLSRDSQCWIAWNGAVQACAVTRVLNDNLKIVELTHCAGRSREAWQELLVEELERWSRHIGADRMRTINRPGYTPMLRKQGYRETHRVMEKDL